MPIHSFPSFYACYLLKSVQTPRSYRNYIGSTQNPVRRLRQHNGFIAQGARRTAAYRPWAMQLLVHGFPSKPAALSFEWAWQNPESSRYLRDSTGKSLFEKRARRLDQNIMVLQSMICTHPFSTWPLHVKLFTEEAVQCWNILTAGANETQEHRIRSFPPGFTCFVEPEGVDGSSGVNGSGQHDPVCITDEYFTSTYLAKHTALIASNHSFSCSVCKSPMHDFPSNHLGTTLCPTAGCITTSHLTCLAKSWLDAERPKPISSGTASNSHPFGLGSGMLPRGGTCTSCGSYTLWGDIVRGCYRRYSGPMSSKKVDSELVKVGNFEVPPKSDSGLEREMGMLKLAGHADDNSCPSVRKSRGTGFLPPLSCGQSGKLVSESATRDVIQCPVSPSLSPITSASAPPAKRKRGRPRKFVQEDGCELGVVLPTLEPEHPETKKRGPPQKILVGEVMPLRSVTMKRSRPELACTKDTFRMASPSSISTQTSPVPGRRGRPRKMNLEIGPVAQLGLRHESGLEPGATGKGERANEIRERQAVGVVLETRKRGRPKKINAELGCKQAVLADSILLRPAMVPRKRGRPKKTSTMPMVLDRI